MMISIKKKVIELAIIAAITVATVTISTILIKSYGSAKYDAGKAECTSEILVKQAEAIEASNKHLEDLKDETNNMELNDVIRDLYDLGIMRDYNNP